MTKLLDIQKAITKMLAKHFRDFDIIVDEQAEDVKIPTFFVSVRPIITNNGLHYQTKKVNIDITYVNEEDNHEENLEITDKLQELLYLDFKVGNKTLLINNLVFSEPSFLICSFTVEFTEITLPNKDVVKMEELFYKE